MADTIDGAQAENGPLIKYSPAEAEIAILKEKYQGLKADTPAGYQQVKIALREVVATRTAIEARRKELKEDSLTWGRKVDAAAKRLQSLIAEIEGPLTIEKKRIDDAELAAARAIVEAEKARIAALEKAAKDAEDARLQAIRDAEEAKRQEEYRAQQIALAAERERLAEERRQQQAKQATIDAENARVFAAQKSERDRLQAEQEAAAKAQREAQAVIDADRRKLDEERARQERIEFERLAREKAEKDAKAKAEQARLDLELQEKARAEEVTRLEIAKPDIEKVKQMADALVWPGVVNDVAGSFLDGIRRELEAIAERCGKFTIRKNAKSPK